MELLQKMEREPGPKNHIQLVQTSIREGDNESVRCVIMNDPSGSGVPNRRLQSVVYTLYEALIISLVGYTAFLACLPIRDSLLPIYYLHVHLAVP